MIYYNSNTIKDWNFGDDNIIKVYRNGAVCYYKVTGGGDTPTAQTPCFAVVDDITQYQETEFEDVFNKADNKWYKLNNLNQYEEYGVYGSGRTSCEGSASRLPQGYTEVEYIENPNLAYIDSGFKPNQDTRILFTFKFEQSQSASMLIGAGGWDRTDGMMFDYEQNLSGTLHISWGGTTVWDVVSSVHGDYDVHTYDWNKNEFYIDDTLVSSTTYRTFQCSDSLGIFSPIQYPYSPFGQQHFACGRLYDFKIYDNGTLVRDLVPCINPSNAAGMYDIVNDVFYTSAYNGYNFIGGEPITPTDCVTTYEGKLTIDEEITPSPSRLPQGYTEVEYVSNTGTSTSNGAYINSGLQLYDAVGNSFSLSGRVKSEYYQASGDNDLETIINSEGTSKPYYGFTYRYAHSTHVLEFTNNPSGEASFSSTANTDGSNDIVINCNQTSVTDQVPLELFASYQGNYYTPYRFAKASFYSLTVVKNGTTVRDFVPAKRDSDSMYGLYDLITDTFYVSPNGNNFSGGSEVTPPPITATCEFIYSGNSWVNVGEVSGGTYPMYYSEMQDPPNNLVFSSMTEAEAYECPWVGMSATINGSAYTFSGDAISGYEWVYNPSRLPSGYTEVEYIENTSTAYVNLDAYIYDSSDTSYSIETKLSSTYHRNEFEYLFATEGTTSPYNGMGYRWNRHTNNSLEFFNVPSNAVFSSVDNGDGTSGVTVTCTSAGSTNNVPLSLFCGIWSSGPWRYGYGKIYNFKLTKNSTLIRDLVPAKRDSDSKYGMYDIVNDVFYLSPNNVNFSGGNPI